MEKNMFANCGRLRENISVTISLLSLKLAQILKLFFIDLNVSNRIAKNGTKQSLVSVEKASTKYLTKMVDAPGYISYKKIPISITI
jgi:hypothetical protein